MERNTSRRQLRTFSRSAKTLAEILSFFWYSHYAETMQICCVCSRQLLAHSCPKPMLRHVRSWRKPTFRVLTSRLPGQVMELGRKAQFSVAPDGRLHSGHQSAGPEEILGEPPLLLWGAKTISSLPADCELPHICFRPARVKIMAEANPGDRTHESQVSQLQLDGRRPAHPRPFRPRESLP